MDFENMTLGGLDQWLATNKIQMRVNGSDQDVYWVCTLRKQIDAREPKRVHGLAPTIPRAIQLALKEASAQGWIARSTEAPSNSITFRGAGSRSSDSFDLAGALQTVLYLAGDDARGIALALKKDPNTPFSQQLRPGVVYEQAAEVLKRWGYEIVA